MYYINTSGRKDFVFKQSLAHSKVTIKQFESSAFTYFLVRRQVPSLSVLTTKCVTLSLHDVCACKSNKCTNSLKTSSSSSVSKLVYVITIFLFFCLKELAGSLEIKQN